MNGAARLVVVGGGILGTMHAVEGARRGWSVRQLERDAFPSGASVRNFGLVWVSGRAPGPELELALRARERWEAIAATTPAVGFRPAGSLTVASTAEELAALELAAALPDAELRGFSLLTPEEVRRREPGLAGEQLGALHCVHDAVVEPRLALGALRTWLETTGTYRFDAGCEAIELGDHLVVDSWGRRHEADLVVCCPGASPTGAVGAALADAPLRRVRLQMLETAPHRVAIGATVADGDSLRYYPVYAGAPRQLLQPQAPVAEQWGAQLLLVQRPGGRLTIGDTHERAEPFAFDLHVEPEQHLLGVAGRLLGGTLPPVERRWEGVYCETSEPGAIYHRAAPAAGVVVVTGPGGRGMTLSPAIAEETFA